MTNIQREHIESHGSFESMSPRSAAIVETLARSPKRSRILVANTDIPESRAFLSAAVSKAIGFSASELKNISEMSEVSVLNIPAYIFLSLFQERLTR